MFAECQSHSTSFGPGQGKLGKAFLHVACERVTVLLVARHVSHRDRNAVRNTQLAVRH